MLVRGLMSLLGALPLPSLAKAQVPAIDPCFHNLGPNHALAVNAWARH